MDCGLVNSHLTVKHSSSSSIWQRCLQGVAMSKPLYCPLLMPRDGDAGDCLMVVVLMMVMYCCPSGTTLKPLGCLGKVKCDENIISRMLQSWNPALTNFLDVLCVGSLFSQ